MFRSLGRVLILFLMLSSWMGGDAFALNPLLQPVLERVATDASFQGQWGTPVVISDLDETLIDSTARRHASIQEAMERLCLLNRNESCGRIAGMNSQDIYEQPNRYDLHSLFTGMGIHRGHWRETLIRDSIDIYLSGRNLDRDQSIPGATEFIQDLHALGAVVFFVSSRWDDVQRVGTLASLKHLGMLPEDDSGERVILRPRGQDSLQFKQEAFDSIRRWVRSHDATVSVVIENEPENMNALTDLFPSAASVFVTGALLRDEPLQEESVLIRTFR